MSVLRLPWQYAAAQIGEQGRRWARRRQGVDPHRLELAARRIYILPTRTGLAYALTVFVLLLGSMNYNNNMGFALTFLLTGVGLVTIHHCHRNLVGLRLDFQGVAPVFAGQQAQFRFIAGNSRAMHRWQIRVAWDRSSPCYVDIGPLSDARFSLPLDAPSRGWMQTPRLAVSTTFPLGLLRAWAWINLDTAALVYPRPADSSPPLDAVSSAQDAGGQQQSGDDEFSGLRDFRPGDSPRRVAWKSVARLGTLLVKEYREGGQRPLWIEWDAVAAANTESRLSTLTRLVLDAHRDQQTFGLRLPNSAVAPQRGEQHVHECLRQLATFGLADGGAVEARPA